MAKKNILSVGFELASNDVTYSGFESDMSLLDWDIILFKPDISVYTMYESETYQGKISLSDTKSFQFKEQCEHWKREITDAYNSGKTVIIFLCDLIELYIDSGKREYSGTGNNQKITRLVKLVNNYFSFPLKLNPKKRKGSSIVVTPKGADIISEYWNAFEGISEYKVTIDCGDINECLVTKNGQKPVGAFIRSKESNGSIICLPDIDFYHERFVEEDGLEQKWTKSAPIFAVEFIQQIILIDNKMHTSGNVTLPPGWSSQIEYSFEIENKIKEELLLIEGELERINSNKEKKKEELSEFQNYRKLLYETGKSLEKVVINGLKVLGFEAENYVDNESEFDVVFKSKEGRLIGEVEGKDNKAINVEKLRQLSMNILEDFGKESVTEQAKGVLFGNAFRKKDLKDREKPFTDKCETASKLSSVALVATSDLFKVVRYLLNTPDDEFAKECRELIISTVGIVSFPEKNEKKIIIEDNEN